MKQLSTTIAIGMAVSLGLAAPLTGTAAESALGSSVLVKGRPVTAWLDEVEVSNFEPSGANKVLIEAGPRVMPTLGHVLLGDKSPERQAKAAWVMSGIGYRNPGAAEVHQAVSALTTGAQCTNNWEIRAWSLQALGAVGRAASNAIPTVIRLTRDQNDSVRLCAADALGRIDATSPESVAALKTCLADETSDVRSVAAKALHKSERNGK